MTPLAGDQLNLNIAARLGYLISLESSGYREFHGIDPQIPPNRATPGYSCALLLKRIFLLLSILVWGKAPECNYSKKIFVIVSKHRYQILQKMPRF